MPFVEIFIVFESLSNLTNPLMEHRAEATDGRSRH